MVLYCCVYDVITRKLPKQTTHKFSAERERLLRIMDEDQIDRASPEFFSTDIQTATEYTLRERARADELLKIIEQIKTPSKQNIGLDGSRAAWLIALHNYDYKNLGLVVLKKMRRLYYKDKNTVFYPGIPFLVDRIMISKQSTIDPDNLPLQLYGTQGIVMRSKDRTISKQFPIIDSQNLIKRRNKFGLGVQSSCTHH